MEKDLTFVAHRLRDGISLAPENSLPAAIDVLNNPYVGGLELDIQQTKDGVFVLMNYKTIENVTKLFDTGKNKISDYLYSELCELNFHANLQEIEKSISTNAVEFAEHAKEMLDYYYELRTKLMSVKIARLEDILKLPRNGKKLFIEIKTDIPKERKVESKKYAKDLAAVLKNYDLNNVTIIGRDTNTLECIKEEMPHLDCCPVVGYDDTEKLTYGFDGVSIAENHLLKEVPNTRKKAIEYLLENDLKTAVWNLRSYEAFKRTNNIFSYSDIDFNPTSDFAAVIAQKFEQDKKIR